jgi:hypothetical protein
MKRSLTIGALLCVGLLVAWGAERASTQAPLVGRPAPEIAGGAWLNSPPLTLEGLRGRVVLVEFWTLG